MFSGCIPCKIPKSEDNLRISPALRVLLVISEPHNHSGIEKLDMLGFTVDVSSLDFLLQMSRFLPTMVAPPISGVEQPHPSFPCQRRTADAPSAEVKHSPISSALLLLPAPDGSSCGGASTMRGPASCWATISSGWVSITPGPAGCYNDRAMGT